MYYRRELEGEGPEYSWSVPWTGILPEVFRERYGYDILSRLPEVFLHLDGARTSRLVRDFFDCVTHLFADSFARQIGDWCEQNGLMHTGHVLSERTLHSQAHVVGATMRFYEFMQAPGIDLLTQYKDEYSTAKQCQSVLHQMGRRWMLSELYGCTGWDFPFEGHKNLGDWQAVLGVNLRCQHLSWYSMAGQAKRDYPASIFFHSPWWEHYEAVEDHFARLNTVLAAGKPVQNLLVIHPVESVWAIGSLAWWDEPVGEELEESFTETIEILLSGHVDFDFGDEEMMSRLASVQDGRVQVGQCAYDAVLVPPCLTLRRSTLELLDAFQEAGGRVVFCRDVPQCVDAEPSEAPAELAERCTTVDFAPADVLGAVAPARVVSVQDTAASEAADVFYQLRHDGDAHYLFVCNRDREEATGPLSICVAAPGQVQLWDTETGERYRVDSEEKDGGRVFRAELDASGSALFCITTAPEDLPAQPALNEVRAEALDDGWTPQLTGPNVLVLDRCHWRVDGGDWQGPHEILKADMEIRDELGMRQRGGRMVQPWARDFEPKPMGTVSLRYRFHVDEVPAGPLALAMEQPDCYHIQLNGRPLSTDAECGWWVDPAIRRVPLDAGALHEGVNELVMTAAMDDNLQLELCYLLGEFSVEMAAPDEPHMTCARPQPGQGDWTEQGLPFYTDGVIWRRRLSLELADQERVFVEVPEFAGACARVMVDGQQAGIIGWRPHEVEVTELVNGRDEVELAVEVISHRRNAFGPLHNTEEPMQWVGPGQFVTHDSTWSDDYQLVPCGLLESPRLSVRK
jgi:hypothetical protein